jgi:DNA-binding CsgD family transcriptional regulator/HD superfamily phosphohydrolase YqeK
MLSAVTDPVGPHQRSRPNRLVSAFAAIDSYPVAAEARQRFVTALRAGDTGQATAAVEADIALALDVLRLGGRRARGSIHGALTTGDQVAILAAVESRPSFDVFQPAGVWGEVPERLRLHAAATQRATWQLATLLDHDDPDRLTVAALLHDVGTLVLRHAYGGYPEKIPGPGGTPEERVHRERTAIGIDHAVVGGVLARRLDLGEAVAHAIERHHAPADELDTDAAIIRLADMLAHYGNAHAIAPTELVRVARVLGLDGATVRSLLFDLPRAAERRRTAGPSPLSSREQMMLRGLAEGRVVKEIALDLGLSPSTIRTHLHNVYGKLGATDRAQAVLIASEQGWL